MVRPDFIINYDPAKDSKEDVTKRILFNLFPKRILNNKPAVAFVSGDSGEGKSYTVVRLEELIFEELEKYLKEKKPIHCKDLKLDIVEHVGTINVHTPLEYPEKMKRILEDDSLKWISILAVHEARNIIRAKDWGKFVSVAISDVNAMSRKIKPLIFFIISQFIRDITTDVRYTLNYYIKCDRPMGSKAHVRIYRIWKDDRDLEKPRLRKRRIWGYIKYPSGKYRKFIPTYLEMNLANKKALKIFDDDDYNAKKEILKNRLDSLILELKKTLDVGENKIDSIVDFYIKNPEQLPSIGKRRGNKWFVNAEFKKMFSNLDDEDIKNFQIKLKEKLGVVEENGFGD